MKHHLKNRSRRWVLVISFLWIILKKPTYPLLLKNIQILMQIILMTILILRLLIPLKLLKLLKLMQMNLTAVTKMRLKIILLDDRILADVNLTGPLTRARANRIANFCGHFSFVSISEPTKVTEAFQEAEWIQAMQDELL